MPPDAPRQPSVWFPRRRRVSLYPWLPRGDRIGSIPGLDHGLVSDEFIPPDDEPRRILHTLSETFVGFPPKDAKVTWGPYEAGTEVLRVEAEANSPELVVDDHGWRLYWTAGLPGAVGALLDTDEIYPMERNELGDPVPKVAWGDAYLSATSPKERVRNFPGYLTLRWTNQDGALNLIKFRVFLEEPVQRS